MNTRMQADTQASPNRHAGRLLAARAALVDRELSGRQLAWVIRRERARADRAGRELSMVLFRAVNGSANLRAMRRLARLLAARARATDEVGRFDDGALCAVLPETGPDGAACLARSVCADAKQHGIDPASVIYTYPSSNFGLDPQPRDIAAPRDAEPIFVRPMPMWKRAVDILGAIALLVLSAPVMLATGVAVKCSSPGAVIFKQRRAGLGGRPFTIYKFRTMVLGAEEKRQQLQGFSEQDGPAFKMRADPRVTPLGRLLRTTSLDELPQLWNVLKGDMSLVGPRPLPLCESDACLPWHRERLEITPGLTCIWQVKGRSQVCFDDWIRMDMRYLRRRTFWHDLKILLLTIPAVVMRRGAH